MGDVRPSNHCVFYYDIMSLMLASFIKLEGKMLARLTCGIPHLSFIINPCENIRMETINLMQANHRELA